MGHLIPLCQFSKRLVHTHSFSITFLVPSDGPLSTGPKSFLDSLIPHGINFVLLPPVNFDDLSNDVRTEARFSLTLSHSLPSLRNVLKSLVSSSRVVALVFDLIATDAFEVAAEFNISPYICFASTSMLLSFVLYLPKLDESVPCEYRDLLELVQIPGCTPVHGKDLIDLVQDRKNGAYKWFLQFGKRCQLAEGIMVNSFKELETGAIKALQEEGPEGFLDRIKGFGLVVPFWAPQAQILSHGSTGGFLTHCGWNSTLESIVNGIPLIAWPLYAEQKMNSTVMLSEDLKVVLRLKVGEHGIIGRTEISQVVKCLMEGEEGNVVRSRMRHLKDAATKVLSKDGESTKSLAKLAQKWKNKIMN
ncbi:hypothetical protein Vadar_010637 [Vaccinium darrowii]|uniref:Uncharacterized protein n=1 Tax=Vaccinium darrowii TaxID=229202 RepID=A0ACB7XZF6_9ERIC|nr:hypothetical protein Vadar_010637 [Vaccinium darrowii]